ncbi:retroviral-like aspartic protease family protein [Phenylobacterium sp.]|uniref:retroviral-like aspartic protease family protein n=1 Tax=Phenylobacterium sp. TaxID=1871053 RepID=UPI002C7DD418|nr:retroviral-like aspartic protease family protein [Phenylobacterium sp.]HLZ76833.1 retroviral-like aspartic protease family protein [Phenylobacterium sp.]
MKIAPFAVLAAALAGPLSAHAACKLATAEVPVTMQGLRPLVAAKIDGQPVQLLLDSGAFGSSLTASFAAQAKLPAVTAKAIGSLVPTSANTVTTGAKGHATETGLVIAPSFEFGGSKFPNVKFLTIRDLDGGASGLVGQNLLHSSDDEYDFKAGVLRLVRPQDCETANLAYWATPQMTYSVLPLEAAGRNNGGEHTLAMISINGQPMRAFFDTGAATSFITQHAAARAGVKTSDAGVTQIGESQGLDGQIKTWVATFASVKIGDEEIKNGKLAIGQSVASDFDVLIGADFFLAHHVYVANSQGKLYFTYSGGPVFRTSAPRQTAASGG